MNEVGLLKQLQLANYANFEDNLAKVDNLVYRDFIEYEYYTQIHKSDQLLQLVDKNARSQEVERQFMAMIKKGYLEHANNSANMALILEKLEVLDNKISSHQVFLHILYVILKWRSTERMMELNEFVSRGREILSSHREVLKVTSSEFERLVLQIYELRIHNIIGIAYFNHGRYDEALIEFKKVEEYDNVEEISKIILLNAISNTGIIKFNQDDYIGAREIFEKNAKLQQEMGLMDPLARTYQNIGVIFGFLEQIDEEINYCEKSLAIKRELNMVEVLPTTLITLADALLKKNRVDQAEEYLNESVSISLKYNNIQHKIGSYNQLGILEWRRGNYNEAIENYQEALGIVEEQKMLRDMKLIYMNLGLIYMELDQLTEAQQYFELALDISMKNNFKIFHGKIYFNLFLLHLRRGEIEICKEMIQKIEDLTEEDIPEEDNAYRKRHIEIMKALLLKEKNSAFAKFQAKQMLEQLYRSNLESVIQKIPVLLNLVELSILELRIVNNEETLQLVEQVIEDLKNTAKTKYLHPLYVNVLILESKFKLINNDLQRALDILDEAEVYSEEFYLPKLLENIRTERRTLEAEVAKWTDLANQGKSMYNKIKDTKIDELLGQLVVSFNQAA